MGIDKIEKADVMAFPSVRTSVSADLLNFYFVSHKHQLTLMLYHRNTTGYYFL